MGLSKKTVAVAALSTMAVSSVLLTTPSFAMQAQKSLEVVYNNIKITYNNQEVAMDTALEPFLVDGSTFIPLRKMGEVFDKNVTWDAATYTVNVTDKTPAVSQSTVDELKKQVSDLTAQLNTAKASLQEKETLVANLQKQVATLSGSTASLDDLEDELNEDYEDYKDTDSTISLDGDKNDINVTIKVTADKWNDLSSSVQKSYLQKIVDDIVDEFDNADVDGKVKSKSDSSMILTFTKDSNDDVDIDSDADLDDLEDELNDDYGDYKGVNLNVKLSGDKNEITIKVYMTDEDWDSLSNSEINTLEDKLLDAVKDEFDGADINGYVYDSDNTSTRLDSF